MDVISEWPVLIIIASSLTVTLCSAAAHLFHSRLVDCFYLFLNRYEGLCNFTYIENKRIETETQLLMKFKCISHN